MKTRFLYRISLILAIATGCALAQQHQSKVSLPGVIGAAVPLYPIGPHTVNIQGTVHVKISTDGQRVIDAKVEDDGGVPALGKAAQENAMTWPFSVGEPTTFMVTYRYILVAKLKGIKSNALNSKVVIRLPTDVEVYAQRWPGTVDVPFKVTHGERRE